MKRVINHPEAERNLQGGRVYWKSVGEYSDTPDFQEWLRREFPQGAAEFWGDGVSRRNFLQLMGASMALAGLGMTGCRRPESHLVAYSKTPEWQVPDRFEYFATSMPTRRGAHALLATSYNGRPIKLEGNPEHPVFQGTTGSWAQASLLNLYDPDRSKQFLRQGQPVDRAALVEQIAQWRVEWGINGGAGWAVLSGDSVSPTYQRLKDGLEAQYPNMLWSTFEPAYAANDLAACAKLFGANTRQRPLLAKAKVILSLDSNFLSSSQGSVEDIRGFASGRDVENLNVDMNRLYVVEPRFTVTGGMADHRLRLPASRVGALAAAVAAELGVAGVSASPVEGVDPAWIKECAQDLRSQSGRALVLVGDEQPQVVHELVAAINLELDAYGKTIEVIDWKQGRGIGLDELAETIESGSIRGLIILNSNPAYAAPGDLEWPELQKKIPTVVHLGYHVDETAALSQWHVPASHYLESWGDGVSCDGSYCCQQPLILPLFDGISEIQFLAACLGQEWTDGPDWVRQTFALVSGSSEDKDWKRFVRDGFLIKSQDVRNQQPPIQGNASLPQVPVSLDSLEIVFAADESMDDGSWANNGWMQELPDPITKITWDNAAHISPATADALGLFYKTIDGVETTDVIEISLNGRLIEIPIIMVPGHADNTLTLPLGYGRNFGGRVADGVGVNVYPFREGSAYFMHGAKVRAVGRRHPFAITQEHWSMEGRGIVRESPIEYLRQNPDTIHHLGLESHTPENRSFYPNPPFDYEKHHQWAMTIDLSTCTGCNACVLACQAENNIPIVGKDQVMKGREMHWIRIDRYFSGASKFKTDAGKEAIPNEPEMVMQPILCQHCENAPCETVCPVNATVHNEEGLNVMAYNRCIGTRYCANNCPYKVRRFNWFDYNARQLDQLYFTGRLDKLGVKGTLKQPLGPKGTEELIKMSKNPHVTVRMRGVIEKCSFCVQRLEAAKIDHKIQPQNRTTGNIKLPTDSVKVACQQACPAQAIVFGDLSDSQSKVNRLRKRQQSYRLLDYLNTQPRVTYLARLRNPNPAMPGADLVGMSLIHLQHAKHGGHSSHHEEKTQHTGGTY
ncbi:MAG: TAT-variant-translocated molybdopterin oxidoreductase [Candidatus Methylacidiphilales bacterium]